MLVLLFVFLMVVGINGSCNEGKVNLGAIEELMQIKCIINSNSTKFENQFKNALSKYVSCVVKTHNADAPHPVDKHQDYCKHLKEGEYRICVKNLTQDILPCLDETEAYLPLLILKSLNASYERFCGTDGLSNTEYMYNTIKKYSECLVTAAGTYLAGGECLCDLSFFKFLDQGILDLSQKNVCSDLVSIPKCVTQVLDRQCNGSYYRFVDLIAQPFIDGCNDLLGKEFGLGNTTNEKKVEVDL